MVMTVHCTSCQTAFPVDPAKIPEEGVWARCSACQEVFRVERPLEEDAPPVVVDEFVTEVSDPLSPEVEVAAEVEDVVESAAFGTPEPEIELPAEEPAFETQAEDFGAVEEPAAADEPILEAEPTFEAEVELEEPAADFGVAEEEPVLEAEPTIEAEVVEPVQEAAPEGEVATEDVAPAEEPVAEDAGRPKFGRRDPKDKAARLARVLVSDIVLYNSARHEKSVAAGTIREDFQDEVNKSWSEYVEQVGTEIAESTDFWREALNEILTKGEELF